MGLAGRKVKQRISNDPRNLSWADDAARFGSNYLSKFGWDASKGLGASGEGRLSHIKVSHKLDMLGIGAAQQRDPNGIAWKQNRDFENLLRRLNTGDESVDGTKNGAVSIDGFHRETENKPSDEAPVKTGDKKKKKRQHSDDEQDYIKPKKKIKNKQNEDEALASSIGAERTIKQEEPLSVAESKLPVSARPNMLPRHRSHRARAIAAKNISSKSAVHISEILGVAPSSSTSTPSFSGPATPQEGTLTYLEADDGLQMEKITTSTKSVADYFKDKLKAKAASRSTSSISTPKSEAPQANADWERPTAGLGFTNYALPGPSKAYIDEEATRLGIGALGVRVDTDNFEESQPLGSASFVSPSAISAPTSDITPMDKTPKKKKEKGKGKDKDRKKRKEGKVTEPVKEEENELLNDDQPRVSDLTGDSSLAPGEADRCEAPKKKKKRKEKDEPRSKSKSKKHRAVEQ